MNAISVIFVSQHLEALQAEAQRNQMASQVARQSLRQQVASAASSLRKAIAGDGGAVVPTLKNYPYGG